MIHRHKKRGTRLVNVSFCRGYQARGIFGISGNRARLGPRPPGLACKKLDLGLTLNCFVRGYLDIVGVVTSRHFDTDFVDCAVTLRWLQWSFIEQRIHRHKNIEHREQSRQLLHLSSCFDIIHNLQFDILTILNHKMDNSYLLILRKKP